MSDQPTFGSWWPFTFVGAARFAYRPLRLLLLLQLLVACAGAAAVMLYFHNAWWPLIPAIAQTLDSVPSEARFAIREFQLIHPQVAGGGVNILGHNSLAGIIVDPDQTGDAGQLSDVQIEFGLRAWRMRSLLGYVQFNYPQGRLDLDASALRSTWEAWKPALMVVIGIASIMLLFVSWGSLATLGAPVAKLIAFFADRDLTIAQSWKLCGAALMPGALFLSAAIVLYAFSRLNLVGLALAMALHGCISLVFVLVAPCRLPKRLAPKTSFGIRSKNPFRAARNTGSKEIE